MVSFEINGVRAEIEIDPNTPLLWAIRDSLNMSGTKFGCGAGLCGACTVHMNGSAIRSCVTPVSAAAGSKITTIEGIKSEQGDYHPVQQAWVEEAVPQCGYCQSGQIMSAVALLKDNPNPSDAEIDSAMAGNICRCGTYARVRRAIHRASDVIAKEV